MHPNIDTLLESVKSGNPVSFDAIYRLYMPLIESTVKSCAKGFSFAEAEKEDMRQEATIALYKAVMAYDPARNAAFGSYAKICMKNRLISYIRCFHEPYVAESADERDPDSNESEEISPEQLIINQESLCNLNRRIDGTLTDFEKSVFTLYVGNMSYADIARTLSKPKKSIDNAIHRIKAKLRKLL